MLSLCGLLEEGKMTCASCSGFIQEGDIHIAWGGMPFLDAPEDTDECGKRIALAYRNRGRDFPCLLDGPFAVALWDASRNQWFLASDPAGTIPLYYASLGPDKIAWGSRIADVLPHLSAIRMHPETLLDYLTYFWTLDDKTFFKDVQLLPQGEVLSSSGATPYFHFVHKDPVAPEVNAEQAIIKCLTESIHAMITPRTGFHLSGGIDSSLIVALAAQSTRASHKTYAVSFPGYADFDESSHGEPVAKRYGWEFIKAEATSQNFASVFSEMIKAIEEPKCHPPVFARFMLEQCSSQDHCGRIITGRGADELFTGYDSHQPDAILMHRQRRTVFDAEARRRLLTQDFLQSCSYSPESRYDECFEKLQGTSLLERVLALDYQGLMKNWLVVDYKISRHFDAECMAPFLTRPMIDLALSLPIHRKHEGTRLKILLKEAAKPWLPASLLTRSKVGFRTPMTEILRDLPASFVRDLLQKDPSSFWDYFDASKVSELLEALYSRGENVGWQVWALLCIREWFRLYLESREGCQ